MHTRPKPTAVLLLALLVLATFLAPPAHAEPVVSVSAPVQAAVQWLHTQQLPDGGFGIGSNPVSSAAMTADVVYSLGLAGEDPGGPGWTVNGRSAIDALASLAPAYVKTDPGQAAKVARAVIVAGGNPRSFAGMDLIAIIQAGYNPANGRFDRNTTYGLTIYRSAMAVEALQLAKAQVEPKAYEALRNAQAADGGWPTSFAGTAGDVDTTGMVLRVLGSTEPGACDAGYMRAARYLVTAQRSTGAWAVDASASNILNANSTALAVAGLRAIGRRPDLPPFVKGGKSGLDALLAFQEAGGAFVYSMPADPRTNRLAATTDALAGLLQPLGDPATAGCLRIYLPLILVR